MGTIFWSRPQNWLIPQDLGTGDSFLGTRGMSDAILHMCIDSPKHGYYITTIVSDDDTNMRAHLKHKKSYLALGKGKLLVSCLSILYGSLEEK